jgi:HipA-like protein
MTNQLIALLDGREVGTVTHKSGRLSFTYSESWLSNPNAYPLSLSMPLGSITHGNKRIEPFLWGLLPDNERVLQSWGREFHVSPRWKPCRSTNGIQSAMAGIMLAAELVKICIGPEIGYGNHQAESDALSGASTCPRSRRKPRMVTAFAKMVIYCRVSEKVCSCVLS